MMGSGKSYWMKRLGKVLGIEHYDLDDLVADREQRSVSRIFSESGESCFREIESTVLKELPRDEHLIIATGGGTPCFHDNMRWMNEAGLTIWLDEPVEVLVQRLRNEKEHRPLIASIDEDQLLSFLERTAEERKPFYSQAQIILRGEEISESNLVAIIKKYLHA